MAVSPGPASTVMRFLRGDCGGGCLCGRLCDACKTGDCQPSEGVVERATPERVVLTDGRVFQRPGGFAPRPGQRVMIDCRPGLATQTPAQQPRGALLTDDVAFIPPLPSYDSPQRPANFGGAQLPQTSPEGTFGGDQGAGALTGTMTLDSGAYVPLGDSPRLDHAQRQLVTWQNASETIMTGYSPNALPAPGLVAGATRPAADQGTPYVFKRFVVDGKEVVLAYQEFSSRGGGQRSYDIQQRTATFAGAETLTTAATLTNPGTIWQAKIVWQSPAGDWLAGRQYQIVSKWRLIPEGILRLRTLQGRFGIPGETYATDWLDLWRVGEETRPKSAWGAEFDGTYEDTAEPFTGAFEGQVWGTYSAPPKRPDGPRFISPDSQVQVTGPDSPDPADLTDSALSAYGHRLSGGTWTALRDNPVLDKNGKWDYSPLIVLHENGDTVTAIRQGVDPQTCTRAAFENEVLRCAVGRFRGFGAIGAAMHSWPPQWCWADCGDDDRALVAYDPWRDSTKRPNQQHPTLAWAARPARRPKLISPNAPRPPLGLSLATVGLANADEPLKKGQGPLQLPDLAEIKNALGQWQVSAVALKALAKRQLYQPAEWPEELDDRTGVRGEVRLTWRSAP